MPYFHYALTPKQLDLSQILWSSLFLVLVESFTAMLHFSFWCLWIWSLKHQHQMIWYVFHLVREGLDEGNIISWSGGTFSSFCWLQVILLPNAGFEDRFQKEASLCSSAIRPSLVKVISNISIRSVLPILPISIYSRKLICFEHLWISFQTLLLLLHWILHVILLLIVCLFWLFFHYSPQNICRRTWQCILHGWEVPYWPKLCSLKISI